MTRKEFEKEVAKAIDGLPAPVRQKLDNVLFLVERRPTAEQLRSGGLPPDDTMLGFYDGTPLTERSHDDLRLPDRIFLFQEPIEEDYGPRREDIAKGIWETVEHEVGHYLGMSEEDLEEHGLD